MLRSLLKQRLDAAAEDIFELFDKTIADYEQELSRLKEKERQHKLLDAVFNPKVQLNRSDVQQLLVVKDDVPPEWSPILDQEDPEPLHIKEEQEELWTGLEGERLSGLEEANITRLISPPFTAVPVKSEDDEEKPPSSQLHQSQRDDDREVELPAQRIITEADGEDCGGSEPAMSLDQDNHSQPKTGETASGSSETEFRFDDWQEPLSDPGPETALNSKEAPLGDGGCNAGKKSLSLFKSKGSLQRHTICNCGKRSSICLVCKKLFRVKQKVHAGEKPFGCDVCGKRFNRRTNLNVHTRIHRGEKPFRCDVCDKRFIQQGHLKLHMIVHTGEKPFGCDVCGKRFNRRTNLNVHTRVHTGEKPFGCDICGKRFNRRSNLNGHTRVHTGEKPFGCDVCGKRFTQQGHLKSHMRVHLGLKWLP